MPRTKTTNPRAEASRPQTVPRAYAGKWVAWTADGLRIVAVGDTVQACERAAAAAGYPADSVAVDKVPVRRRRLDGTEG